MTKLEAKAALTFERLGRGLPMMTFHHWFRWFPTVSWHVCFPSCVAADMTWVIQVVSSMSWHVFVFKLHCRRHDMSDEGGLQHVLACLFCSLNCMRWRQVTLGSEAADRLATSKTKKKAMAWLQREWLVSRWFSPWRYDRRYVRRFASNKT